MPLKLRDGRFTSEKLYLPVGFRTDCQISSGCIQRWCGAFAQVGGRSPNLCWVLLALLPRPCTAGMGVGKCCRSRLIGQWLPRKKRFFISEMPWYFDSRRQLLGLQNLSKLPSHLLYLHYKAVHR